MSFNRPGSFDMQRRDNEKELRKVAAQPLEYPRQNLFFARMSAAAQEDGAVRCCGRTAAGPLCDEIL